MTSNVSNQGIAHAAWKAGGTPLCGNRRAHFSFSIERFREDAREGGLQCRRCANKLADMDRRLAEKTPSKPFGELK